MNGRNENPNVKTIGDMLKNIANKKRQVKEEEQLPKPKTQAITDKKFEWVWKPLYEITITATYSRESGGWFISLDCPDRQMALLNDDAKLVGEALLASYEWQFIWKAHVADYMLREVAGEVAGEVVSDAGVAGEVDGQLR